AGSRSFDKVLRLGKPKLAAPTTVSAAIKVQDEASEQLLARLEEAKVKKPQDILKLEEELLSKVKGNRQRLLSETLVNDKTEYSDITRHLYPGLQYGALAK